MRKDDRVRWQDARAIFGLLDEISALGDEPAAWRAAMLRGLGALVGAQVGVASEAPCPFDPDPSTYIGTLDLGWASPRERSFWAGTCALRGADADPSDERFQRVGTTSFTTPRGAFVDDPTWYRSPFANERMRPAGIDHYLVTHRVVPRFAVVHAVMLYRPWGARPFDDAETRLIELFHEELGRRWDEASPEADLPPRLHQTLAALRAGDSEKQVADRLGISPSTVHDHVKALHRRFGAHSRGELLAAAARGPRFPRLQRAASMTPGGAGSRG
jgi:DNA-binding CsgD family transcriptional regulator